MPLVAGVLGFLARNEASANFDLTDTHVRVVFVPEGTDAAFRRTLDDLNLRPIGVRDVAVAVQEEHDSVGLVIPPDLTAALTEGRPFRAQILLAGGSTTTRLVQARVSNALDRFRSDLLAARISGLGLPPSLAMPIPVEVTIATGPSDANAFAALAMIPFLLAVQVLQLTTTVIADAIAGAKERRVLESLLASSATRTELLASAGFVAVLVGALAGLLTPTVGVFAMQMTSGNTNLVTPSLLSTFLGAALLIAVTGAAAGIVAGTLAKTTQQANLMLLPLIFGTVMPLSALAFGASTVPNWVFAIPSLGPALLATRALDTGVPASAWPFAVAGTAMFAALCLTVGARMFHGERVVTRV